MNSQMVPQAVQSLDMILGLSSQTPARKAAGIGEFSRFFGLSSQVATLEARTLPGMSPDESFPAGIEVLGQAMMILPADLAAVLMSGSKDHPELTVGQSVFGESERPLAIQAEILKNGNTDDPEMFLRLASGKDGEQLSGFFPQEEMPEETIIPLRLRTVEEQGGRLLAEAELITATGQELPVRLKLELAGDLHNIHRQYGISDNPANSANQNFRFATANLTRMLGELGVTRIVIENNNQAAGKALPINSAGGTGLSTAAMMTGQATQSSGINGNTADPGRAVDNQAAIGRIADHLTPEDQGGRFDGASDNANLAERSLNGRFLSLQPKASLENALSLAESGIDGGFEALTERSTMTSSQVRYINLDARLDQLKRNPGQTIRIQLVPAQLGKMDLSISAHRGTVTVSLVLDSVASKNAVEKNISHLESRLAAAGIRVDNFNITVNQPSKGESFAGYYQHQAYDESQQRGGQRRSIFDQRRLKQFHASDVSFDKVMVNCLA